MWDINKKGSWMEGIQELSVLPCSISLDLTLKRSVKIENKWNGKKWEKEEKTEERLNIP